MNLLRELLEAKKEKHSPAQNVYHRDYVKTKARPYRKYDKNKRAKLSEVDNDIEVIDSEEEASTCRDCSGSGEGQYEGTRCRSCNGSGVDRRVAEDVNASPAMSQPNRGMQDSFKSPQQTPDDLGGQLTELVKLLNQYDKLKTATVSEPQQNSQQPSIKPSLQFSSLLHRATGALLAEAKWGASNQAPKTDTAQDSNNDAQPDDLAATKKASNQQIKKILDAAKQLGPDAQQQLSQLCQKHCGTQANRVLTVLNNAAKQLNIQLQ
jgi:hypothetical protein